MSYKNNNNKNKGFTLIELMIVVAIVGILSSMAIYVYNDFLVRARILEGISVGAPTKSAIGTAVATRDDLTRIANSWNNQNGGSGSNSKFVESVLVDGDTGIITITFIAGNVGIKTDETTLVFTPWVRSGTTLLQLEDAITDGVTGSVDWACTSASKETASDRGMGDSLLGSLRSKFAPSECR